MAGGSGGERGSESGLGEEASGSGWRVGFDRESDEAEEGESAGETADRGYTGGGEARMGTEECEGRRQSLGEPGGEEESEEEAGGREGVANEKRGSTNWTWQET